MDLTTQLDPARDLQRLHTLIVGEYAKLNFSLLMNHSLENMIIGNITSMSKCFDASMPKNEETELTRQTLRRLNDEAMNLEQIHRNHRNKEQKEMKVGSKKVPIGDDNYLRGISSSSLNSGSATTPRPITTTNQLFDLPPFQRGHFLRNSDGFSHF